MALIVRSVPCRCDIAKTHKPETLRMLKMRRKLKRKPAQFVLILHRQRQTVANRQHTQCHSFIVMQLLVQLA